MIINHKRKFIFVHIQKTAGSSITQALHQIEGSERIAHPHSMINIIDMEVYRDYFAFCIVRNPYERLVSWWNMMLHKGIHNDFSHYLLTRASNFSQFLDCTDIIDETNDGKILAGLPYPKSIAFNQLDYIMAQDGRMAMDFIGRFENVTHDFDRICDRIGIKVDLPHVNAYQRSDYRGYFSAEDVSKVQAMCHRDLEYFGYEF